MRKNLYISIVSAIFLAGCVTAEGPTIECQDGVSVPVNEELKQLREENKALKEKIASLEKENLVKKMPTAAEIQTALKNAKFYDGQIDNQIGTKTKEAIKKFQEANGLNPDGAIGSRTWEKLSQYLK